MCFWPVMFAWRSIFNSPNVILIAAFLSPPPAVETSPCPGTRARVLSTLRVDLNPSSLRKLIVANSLVPIIILSTLIVYIFSPIWAAGTYWYWRLHSFALTCWAQFPLWSECICVHDVCLSSTLSVLLLLSSCFTQSAAESLLVTDHSFSLLLHLRFHSYILLHKLVFVQWRATHLSHFIICLINFPNSPPLPVLYL